MTNIRGKSTGILLVSQAVFVLLFGLFVELGKEAGPATNYTTHEQPEKSELDHYYPMYQDVHVMMLVGFGFLMTFLKRHGFGSLGFTFLILCFVIEWSLLVNGWFSLIGTSDGKFSISIESLLHADFAAATVLISFGAILGVASPAQLIIMSILEIVFYNVSYFIGVEIFGALDVGGSIFVHAFGAYFGLAVAKVLYEEKQTTSEKEGSTYQSDISAMIGTTFLWLFWPSFNSSPATDNERHRAVVNTVLSLAACTVVTIAISAVVDKKGKLNMVHIQNATLAGGVVMGASADIIVHPFGALLVGSVAAVASTLGFQYLQPILQRKINLHDTCGVNNLHGITGILGAVISAIVISVATRDTHLASYDKLFVHDSTSPYRININQAGAQVVAMLISVAIAIVSGAITGFILKIPIFDNLDSEEFYEDGAFWQVEDETEDNHTNNAFELTSKKELEDSA